MAESTKQQPHLARSSSLTWPTQQRRTQTQRQSQPQPGHPRHPRPFLRARAIALLLAGAVSALGVLMTPAAVLGAPEPPEQLVIEITAQSSHRFLAGGLLGVAQAPAVFQSTIEAAAQVPTSKIEDASRPVRAPLRISSATGSVTFRVACADAEPEGYYHPGDATFTVSGGRTPGNVEIAQLTGAGKDMALVFDFDIPGVLETQTDSCGGQTASYFTGPTSGERSPWSDGRRILLDREPRQFRSLGNFMREAMVLRGWKRSPTTGEWFTRAVASYSGGGDSGTLTINARLTRTHHYRVETKAFIPKAWIVDPEWPVWARVLLPQVTLRAECQTGVIPDENPSLFVDALAEYEGDGHVKYGGTYRARAWTEFDWDGEVMTNVETGGDFGLTRRRFIILGPDGSWSRQCAKTARATKSAGARKADRNTVKLDYSGTNPLTLPLVTPSFDAEWSASVNAAGVVTVDYLADRFPSHAVKVTRDGRSLGSRVLVNAACVQTDGLAGAAAVGLGLISHTAKGQVRFSPKGGAEDIVRPCLP